MRQRLRSALALATLTTLPGASTGCSSCSTPSPAPTTMVDAAPAPPLPPPSAHRPRRDPPPIPSGAIPPQPKAQPTWALDPDDPARDYVDRYVRSTYRYGPQTSCVVIGKSQFSGGNTTVAVNNDTSGACGTAGELRETFEVNVAADRLSMVDPSKHDALKKWPDGSDPEGPAGMAVEKDARAWKAPLHEALTKMELVPVRLQWYGRGTYPIITIAGWHGELTRDATPDKLRDIEQRLCPANDNRPFAVFAGIDRSTILRFDCPDRVRLESL